MVVLNILDKGMQIFGIWIGILVIKIIFSIITHWIRTVIITNFIFFARLEQLSRHAST